MIQLAIVIPYYKIDFFQETLQSVAQQTNKNFTLYIGNDASPEEPISLIEKYFKKEDYIYFDYTENIGRKNLALQWERILENVSEEWFQILGDDDMIAENFVEEFYNSIPILKKEKISCIKFVHEWIDGESNFIKLFDYNVSYLNSIDFFIQKYNNEVGSSLSENIFQTKMYRKYGFEKIPLAWGSDDIALLTFSNFRNILYNRKTKVQVRISDASISGSLFMDKEKNIALNICRKKIVTVYSKYFPKNFINKMIGDYLYFCKINKQKANFIVAKHYLKKGNFISFLKIIRRIYYINLAIN